MRFDKRALVLGWVFALVVSGCATNYAGDTQRLASSYDAVRTDAINLSWDALPELAKYYVVLQSSPDSGAARLHGWLVLAADTPLIIVPSTAPQLFVPAWGEYVMFKTAISDSMGVYIPRNRAPHVPSALPSVAFTVEAPRVGETLWALSPHLPNGAGVIALRPVAYHSPYLFVSADSAHEQLFIGAVVLNQQGAVAGWVISDRPKNGLFAVLAAETVVQHVFQSAGIRH